VGELDDCDSKQGHTKASSVKDGDAGDTNSTAEAAGIPQGQGKQTP
jgi:hypothetical protein